MKKAFAVLVGLAICAIGWFMVAHRETPNRAGQSVNTKATAFDKHQLSIGQADSLWLIVNKRRALQPTDYKPTNLVAPNMPLRLSTTTPEMLLRDDAARALAELAQDAQKDAGLRLMLSSGYRSYTYQKNLYNLYVKQQGQAAADTQSARPGHSEHQTGLAADVEPATRKCEVEACFADLPEGRWVAANAHKYGFVVRYQKDMDQITGYTYEPWHLRYVGTILAAELHRHGDPLLETFFGLDAAPDYKP